MGKTATQVCDDHNCTYSQLRYVIRLRKIHASRKVGNVNLYDAEAEERIAAALASMNRRQAPVPQTAEIR
jgi:hypothetical protein